MESRDISEKSRAKIKTQATSQQLEHRTETGDEFWLTKLWYNLKEMKGGLCSKAKDIKQIRLDWCHHVAVTQGVVISYSHL